MFFELLIIYQSQRDHQIHQNISRTKSKVEKSDIFLLLKFLDFFLQKLVKCFSVRKSVRCCTPWLGGSPRARGPAARTHTTATPTALTVGINRFQAKQSNSSQWTKPNTIYSNQTMWDPAKPKHTPHSPCCTPPPRSETCPLASCTCCTPWPGGRPPWRPPRTRPRPRTCYTWGDNSAHWLGHCNSRSWVNFCDHSYLFIFLYV